MDDLNVSSVDINTFDFKYIPFDRDVTYVEEAEPMEGENTKIHEARRESVLCHRALSDAKSQADFLLRLIAQWRTTPNIDRKLSELQQHCVSMQDVIDGLQKRYNTARKRYRTVFRTQTPKKMQDDLRKLQEELTFKLKKHCRPSGLYKLQVELAAVDEKISLLDEEDNDNDNGGGDYTRPRNGLFDKKECLFIKKVSSRTTLISAFNFSSIIFLFIM